MRTVLAFGAALLPLTLPVSAADVAAPEQKPIEEIVVTGDFRDTPLERLPASVSVIGAQDIDARGARHLDEVLGLAANVNVAGGSARARFFQIRGIGERSQFIEPLNPSVGLLVDGVDLSDSAMAATLFDVDQVEIFRGPQGTRFGANALAGLINIKTRAPTETFDALMGMEAADYGTWAVNGALSGPLSKNLSARIAAQQLTSDGFLRNGFLNRDTNKRDERSFRGKLHWTPGADTVIDTMLGYVNLHEGYDAFSLDNNRTTLSDEPGRDNQRTVFGNVALASNGNAAFAVEASAAAASSYHAYGYDEDWTFLAMHPDTYSSTDYYFRDRRDVTGEIKLLSKESARLFGGRGDWVVGLYALERSEDLRREYTYLSGPFTSQFDVERIAAFGELKTSLGERTTLTTGARIEQHKSTYRDSDAVAFSPKDEMTGWRISLDRELRETLMTYLSISRGYKAGGFNMDGSLDEDLRLYDPEKLVNYEFGFKGRFLEQRLSARVTAFYMQRKDVQIASSLTRVRPNGSSEFIDYIGNAAEGMNAGVETELTFQATDALELVASLGFLKSEYESFVNAAGENFDGREQAHAPEYQFAVRARYAITPSWYAEVGAEGRDAFYYSDSDNTRSDPYRLFNATLGYRKGAWETKVWARNLTDEAYHTRGYFFGNDPRIGYADRSYTQLGDPRQIGITTSWQFN